MNNLDADPGSCGPLLIFPPCSDMQLPPEIIFQIIDELGNQPRTPISVSTLKNVASLSKMCHFGARKHIFDSINLSCSITHRGAAEYKLFNLMAIIDAQPDVPSLIHTVQLCFPSFAYDIPHSYMQEANRFVKSFVSLNKLDYLNVSCIKCRYAHIDYYNHVSYQDICATLPQLFRMPSILELNLGSLYDPNYEILISLLTTHSRLTKLWLGDLHAGYWSRNPVRRNYCTGSIHTLILGDNALTNVVDLVTKCGAQMFDSIKHLVFENAHAAHIIEHVHNIDIGIRTLIQVLASKVPRFTWNPTQSDGFPESHITIDLYNRPSSKCLALTFLPVPVEDSAEINSTKFTSVVTGLLEGVAIFVTIDELKIWFHDGYFASGCVDLMPTDFWTELGHKLNQHPFLELEKLIFSIPVSESNAKSFQGDGDWASGAEKLVRAISRDLSYVHKSKINISIRYI